MELLPRRHAQRGKIVKEHEIRELVNRLRDIAVEYRDTQQLRDHIAHAVNAAIKLVTLINEDNIQSGNSGQVSDEKLPLNYLQGQKDGLEWAAQMAEASHPQTGDWLYDDPVELAKAIRKGPDMPKNDNTLVIPDGLIAAVNRLLDSDGSRGCYDAMVRGEARDEIERLLAAVKGA